VKLTGYIFIFLSLLLFSCVKDKPNDQMQPEVTIGSGPKVYVTSEGNFGSNNASVTLYENGNVVSDIYKSQNNNALLGDVCQSMNKINNKYYIVVNNSGKIVVVNSSDFKLITTINGLQSPRFILPVTFNKAYVSDLYANSISIVDLNTSTKTGSIPCGGWTEQMTLIYNKAFITNNNSGYAYVINTITDQITDSINVGPFAGSIVTDKNSKIWILSSGNSSSSTAGKLMRIDPVTLTVELNLPFSSSDSPSDLCINATKDTLYFLNKNVYQMNISSGALPSSPFITGTSNTFYGLSVSDKDYNVYVSDAIDYIQKSSILVYSPSGSLKTSFKAGINASNFYFE
jgi:DNA-binding beta-propeller fold protein YncE